MLRKPKKSQKGGGTVTVIEFRERSLDHVIAWFDELYLLLKDDREAKKIEPEQKRKLIGTGLSLLLYVQETLESDLNGSDKSISEP